MPLANLGNVEGRPLKIWYPKRQSASAPVKDPILYWGDSKLKIDTQNMQPRLVRAMPKAYATVPGKAWVEFIRTAVSMGVLT